MITAQIFMYMLIWFLQFLGFFVVFYIIVRLLAWPIHVFWLAIKQFFDHA